MKKHSRSVCPVACALDIIGDKWTLLVVRDILLGRKYFKEFLASPEGIATNILTNRLSKLVAEGIVKTSPDKATMGRYTYSLTERGVSIIPIIDAIKNWGLAQIKGTSIKIKNVS